MSELLVGDRYHFQDLLSAEEAATFADLIVVWARDVADDQVKGFVVRGDAPGFTATKIENKIVLRIVQNADLTLTDVRVPRTRSPWPTRRSAPSSASRSPRSSWSRTCWYGWWGI